MRDLTPVEVLRDFVSFVERFHAEHDYEQDFSIIADRLGINVRQGRAGERSYATSLPDGRFVIFLEPGQTHKRQRFTSWHELCHVLFELAREGELKAFIQDYAYGNDGLARELEETICYLTAGVLLMPSPHLQTALELYGPSPLAVFELTRQTGSSVQAATRRLVQSLDLDAQAVLCTEHGVVIDSFNHGTKQGRYSVGRNFIIEADHPSLIGSHSVGEVECFTAPVPYKGGGRSHHSDAIAAWEPNGKRILTFYFAKGKAPGAHNAQQRRLFV